MGASSSARRTWAPCSSSMDPNTKASPNKAHLIVRDTSTTQDVPETDPLIPPRDRYTAEASCQHLVIANVTPHAPTPPWEAAITAIVIARARSGVDSCRRPFVSRTGRPAHVMPGLCSRMSPDGRCTCVVPQDQPYSRRVT
jgi:hypothetical protein